MVEQPKTPPNEAPNDSAVKPLNPTRRRWLQAGLSASPVLMTVISRPVLAAQCVAPSAFVSLGASGPGTVAQCTGNGPTYWSDSRHYADWPSGYVPQDVAPDATATQWCQAVTCVAGDPFQSSSLLQVLMQTGNEVARYVGAAVLNNAAPQRVPETVLGMQTIRHIWSEFATSDHFTPSPGASWSAAEIVDYLKSTMTTS
jgi:hypothetical protein